jgi:hypothetical protein
MQVSSSGSEVFSRKALDSVCVIEDLTGLVGVIYSANFEVC